MRLRALDGVEHALVRPRVARDDHAMDIVLGDDARELVRRAQHRRGRRPGPRVDGDPPHERRLHVRAGLQLGPRAASATAASPTSRQRSGGGGVARDGAGGHAAGDLQDRQPEPGDRHEARAHGRAQHGALQQESDDRRERRGVEDGGRLVEGALAQEQLVTPVEPRRRVDDDDQRQERERRRAGTGGAEDPIRQPDHEQAREHVGGHQRAAEDALAVAHGLVRAALDQQRQAGCRNRNRGRAPSQTLAALGTVAIYADAEHAVMDFVQPVARARSRAPACRSGRRTQPLETPSWRQGQSQPPPRLSRSPRGTPGMPAEMQRTANVRR